MTNFPARRKHPEAHHLHCNRQGYFFINIDCQEERSDCANKYYGPVAPITDPDLRQTDQQNVEFAKALFRKARTAVASATLGIQATVNPTEVDQVITFFDTKTDQQIADELSETAPSLEEIQQVIALATQQEKDELQSQLTKPRLNTILKLMPEDARLYWGEIFFGLFQDGNISLDSNGTLVIE